MKQADILITKSYLCKDGMTRIVVKISKDHVGIQGVEWKEPRRGNYPMSVGAMSLAAFAKLATKLI